MTQKQQNLKASMHRFFKIFIFQGIGIFRHFRITSIYGTKRHSNKKRVKFQKVEVKNEDRKPETKRICF